MTDQFERLKTDVSFYIDLTEEISSMQAELKALKTNYAQLSERIIEYMRSAQISAVTSNDTTLQLVEVKRSKALSKERTVAVLCETLGCEEASAYRFFDQCKAQKEQSTGYKLKKSAAAPSSAGSVPQPSSGAGGPAGQEPDSLLPPPRTQQSVASRSLREDDEETVTRPLRTALNELHRPQ